MTPSPAAGSTLDEQYPDRYRTFLIFGAPGSGKGTQGKALGSIPRLHHFACGDVFRSLDTRSRLGKSFLDYSSRGELVPAELTVELWKESIVAGVEAHRYKPELDYLVLDGIPRNVEQARAMKPLIKVCKVFHLTCPNRTELLRRLKKRAIKDNRLDDANDNVIRQRLDVYESESKPVLEYYGPELVQTIDAQQPPVRVMFEILQTVQEFPMSFA